uniref:Ig-like domain-containing protein n=1 Tax=Biomphalaria glabrata TaxID=6526 RepID=A0A2C9KA07_BIOGL
MNQNTFSKLVLFIAFELLKKFSVSENKITCSAVEEGSTATLLMTWRARSLSSQVMISLNNQTACSCYVLLMACDIYDNQTEATIAHLNGLKYNITVSSSKIFFGHGFWTVNYIGEDHKQGETEFVCSFLYFVKARDVLCKSSSEDDIYIVCATKIIYPKGKCIFKINHNSSLVSTVPSTIETHKMKHSHHRVNFASTCTLVVPILLESVGTYTVDATMYPNISGNISDSKFGSDVTLIIVFDRPSIRLESCPKTVRNGDTVHCLCVMRGVGSSTALYSWYNRSSNVLLSNKSMLTFTMNEFSTEFTCKVQSLKLLMPMNETYFVVPVQENWLLSLDC